MADDTIAISFDKCLKLFGQLSTPGLSESFYQGNIAAISKEETRFKIWSGNISAHKSGRRSLQYRLRDASHLLKQVLELLEDLADLLQDALSIASGQTIPWDQVEGGDAVGGESSPWPASEKDGEGPDSEMEQIATNIADVVNCLLRLSVAIRNPAPHDRFATRLPIDASHYEPFDIGHVRAKFSNIDPVLAELLGKSMARRRQYFRYRESHHLKLSHGLDPLDLAQDSGTTVASSIPEGAKAVGFGILSRAIDEDNMSDSGETQTSFASSNADSDTISFPPLPQTSHNEPFECPYCYMMITATSKRSWRRHVLADLRPYVCLSPGCAAAERGFIRRHEWIMHEIENHWRAYDCPWTCGKTFQSESECREHVKKCHPTSLTRNQIDAMINLGSRSTQTKSDMTCPMCKERCNTIKGYQRHVGRHQEQLALFTLPSIASLEDDKKENESVSSQSEGAAADDTPSQIKKKEKSVNQQIIDMINERDFKRSSRSSEEDSSSNDSSKDNEKKIPANEPDLRLEYSPAPALGNQDKHEYPQRSPKYNSSGNDDTEPGDLVRLEPDPLRVPNIPGFRFMPISRESQTSVDGAPQKEDLQHIITPSSSGGEQNTPRGILKLPSSSFPEEDNPAREGVAPHKNDPKYKEAPPGAKWTKINRKLVDVEALTIGKERFEVRDDFVIVLRVLNKEEIQAYATATQTSRERARESTDNEVDESKLEIPDPLIPPQGPSNS